MGASASRNAKIEITSSAAGMDRGLADARRKMHGFQRDSASAFEKASKQQAAAAGSHNSMLAGGLRSAVGGVAAIAGIDLSGGIVGIASDVMDFEKRLTRFQIIAGKTTAGMNDMRVAVNGVSRETGIARDKILEGAQTYVDLTGDVAGAERSMRVFARVAQASESSIADVATSAAALQDSMHIKPDEMEAVFSGLISQGKLGAVNLKDFAGELSSILPRFARFGVLGKEGVVQLGAMFQIGRKGFGSASETATGMAGLMGGLTLHASKFEAAGVKIYNVAKDGTKSFRPLNEIIKDIAKSKLAKDPTLLTKAFGRKEGLQFYQMLVDHVGEFDALAKAGEDAGTVQRDLDTYMQSSSGKMEKAWNDVKIAIAEALTPERIKKFTEELVKAGAVMEKLINGLSKFSDFAEKYGLDNSLLGNLGDSGKWLGRKIYGNNDADDAQDARDKRGAALERMHPDERHDQIAGRLQEEDQTHQNLHRQIVGQGNTYSLAELIALIPKMATATDPKLEPMIAAAIQAGLAKASITVKVDSSTLAKKVENSPHARSAAGRK